MLLLLQLHCALVVVRDIFDRDRQDHPLPVYAHRQLVHFWNPDGFASNDDISLSILNATHSSNYPRFWDSTEQFASDLRTSDKLPEPLK